MATVLVICDDDLLLALLCEALALGEMHGVAVHPREVATLISGATQPDVVLLDLSWRGRCGVEIATSLRGTAFAATPIIALYATPRELAVARQSGVFRSFLEKPFDVEDLLCAVCDAAGTGVR